MDVLSFEPSRAAPYRGPEHRRPTGRLGSIRAWLERLLDLRPAAPDPGADGPGADAMAIDARRNLLYGYVSALIILGLGLLVSVTLTGSVSPGIASDALAGTVLGGPTGGVLLWTMFGLMGSVRSFTAARGSAHFTFHLPFVGAATILGGPVAGAWVAFLSTIERRELETLPWYGVLANHTSMVIAAVAGAATYVGVEGFLGSVTGDARLATFVAIIAASLVVNLGANAFAVGIIKIRDDMTWAGVLGIFVDDFRRETIIEVALIWVLVIAWSTVGWWAPLVVGVGVVWYASHERAGEGPDQLSGLPRKGEFLRRVERKIGWIRRGILSGGTMLYLDLNGFHAVNNEWGHEIGDAALRVISERITGVVTRREDLVSRLMGDEYGVFLAGMTSPRDAMRKAEQLLDAIAKPVSTPVGPVTVGVAIGVVVVDGTGAVPPSAMTVLRHAEQAMYIAKRGSGPQGGVHVYADGEESPFSADWIEAQR